MLWGVAPLPSQKDYQSSCVKQSFSRRFRAIQFRLGAYLKNRCGRSAAGLESRLQAVPAPGRLKAGLQTEISWRELTFVATDLLKPLWPEQCRMISAKRGGAATQELLLVLLLLLVLEKGGNRGRG